MIPMVTADGFLQPCCQVGNNYWKYQYLTDGTKLDHNPFIDPDFSLYNKSFEEIVESDKWNNFVGTISESKLSVCHNHCGSKQAPRNSALNQYNLTVEWDNKHVLTKDIDAIQLETSNRCTLECGYCSRLFYKRRNSNGRWLNRFDLSLDIIEDILQYKVFESILDCGTYGDPIYYKYYHGMLELFLSNMFRRYRVSIAATGKTQKWWDQTHSLWEALIKSGTPVIIFWGVDGLKDTSSIHRINQDWDEITTQMKRAATYGAYGHWQYIPMNFNEHQIEDAKLMAKDWGVNFYLKPSDRFYEGDPNTPKHDRNRYILEENETGGLEYKNIPDVEVVNNIGYVLRKK